MADKKLSQLTAGATPVDADLYYSVQAGVQKSVTALQIATYTASKLSVAASLSLTAFALGTAAFTGDVTTSANSVATTIAAGAVSYSKMTATESASTLLGNPTGGATNPSEITLGATLAFSGTALQTAAFTGDVTTSANSFATTIANAAVSYAKMQNTAASRLLGNPTGSPAAPSEISLGATLAFSGTAIQTAALTGDVTASANSFATTIANSAVSNAKMANATNLTLKSNVSGGSAAPADNTLTAILDAIISSSRGAVIVRKSSTWQPLAFDTTSGHVLQSDGSDVVWGVGIPAPNLNFQEFLLYPGGIV